MSANVNENINKENPNFLTGFCRIALYPLNIPLEERRKKRLIFPSILKTVPFLKNETSKTLNTKLRKKIKVIGKDNIEYAPREITEKEYIKEVKSKRITNEY